MDTHEQRQKRNRYFFVCCDDSDGGGLGTILKSSIPMCAQISRQTQRL